MKPIITDLTNSSPAKLKPIELVSCLQLSKNENGYYYFYKGEGGYQGHLQSVNKVTRLATAELNQKYDLIETDINGIKNIFLGHWNDGVI